jgi:hypothetical protein
MDSLKLVACAFLGLGFSSSALAAESDSGSSSEAPTGATPAASASSEAAPNAEAPTEGADGSATADATPTDATADVSADETDMSTEEMADEALPPRLLEAALGMRLYSRSFRYTDTLAQALPAGKFQDLPAYALAAAPMPYIELGVFPLVKSSSVFLQNIGVVGGFEMGIATDVNYAGTKLDQTHLRYHVGLKYRIPVGRVSIQPVVEYGGHQFSITAPSGVPAPFPSVNYSMLEVGSDLVWLADPITIRAYGRFLLPFALGDVASSNWFPSASALGTNWGGQVGFAVTPMIDVLVNVDARVYGLDFNQIEDTTSADKVAGGATDQYVSASLGIGFHFPKTPTESE